MNNFLEILFTTYGPFRLVFAPNFNLCPDTEVNHESTIPQNWDWVREELPRHLSDYLRAPNEIGFYELGYIENGYFSAKYAGRAKGVTLRQRLGQHYLHSHNENVRKNRDKLYFRCKVFKTKELASYVEAVSIAAFEYPWNKRNEWTQHWILEQ